MSGDQFLARGGVVALGFADRHMGLIERGVCGIQCRGCAFGLCPCRGQVRQIVVTLLRLRQGCEGCAQFLRAHGAECQLGFQRVHALGGQGFQHLLTGLGVLLPLRGLACALFSFGQVGNGQPLQQGGQLGRDVIALHSECRDVGTAGLHGDATDAVDLNFRATHHRAA